mmetsp:Transcript_38335/g.95133  ORF Transcript_38335/g.95133 Transcript_38335/m.95133 type:complete len:214 (-) Transcript_38335:16-657(-)
MYRRSFLRTPPATSFFFMGLSSPAPGSRLLWSSSGSKMTTHFSSTSRMMLRAPFARSTLVSGRARTATCSVACDTPLRLSTRVNLSDASTSSASWSSRSAFSLSSIPMAAAGVCHAGCSASLARHHPESPHVSRDSQRCQRRAGPFFCQPQNEIEMSPLEPNHRRFGAARSLSCGVARDACVETMHCWVLLSGRAAEAAVFCARSRGLRTARG